MKKRAGIFDPWRQEAPPAVDNTPARKTPSSEHPAIDDTWSPPETCIQFNGIRAGLFVWLVLDGSSDESARARKVLVDFVHRVGVREGVDKILQGWGIYLGTPKQPNPVVVDGGDKKITVSVPVDDPERLVPRAIDAVSLALRELAQQFPDVRDTLQAVKLKPYLK